MNHGLQAIAAENEYGLFLEIVNPLFSKVFSYEGNQVSANIVHKNHHFEMEVACRPDAKDMNWKTWEVYFDVLTAGKGTHSPVPFDMVEYSVIKDRFKDKILVQAIMRISSREADNCVFYAQARIVKADKSCLTVNSSPFCVSARHRTHNKYYTRPIELAAQPKVAKRKIKLESTPPHKKIKKEVEAESDFAAFLPPTDLVNIKSEPLHDDDDAAFQHCKAEPEDRDMITLDATWWEQTASSIPPPSPPPPTQVQQVIILGYTPAEEEETRSPDMFPKQENETHNSLTTTMTTATTTTMQQTTPAPALSPPCKCLDSLHTHPVITRLAEAIDRLTRGLESLSTSSDRKLDAMRAIMGPVVTPADNIRSALDKVLPFVPQLSQDHERRWEQIIIDCQTKRLASSQYKAEQYSNIHYQPASVAPCSPSNFLALDEQDTFCDSIIVDFLRELPDLGDMLSEQLVA